MYNYKEKVFTKLAPFFLKPFTLINSPRQKLILIGVCLGFGVLFTNIFIPFNVNQWEQDSGVNQFLRLTSYCFIIALSLLFTQFIIRKLFKVYTFVVWSFILWFLGEVIFISLMYLLIYNDDFNSFWELFKFSFQHTLLGISIPYLFALIILSLIQLRSVKPVIQNNKTDLIGIPDEKGVVKISLLFSSILYIESADNYIEVYYLDEDLVKAKLIRNTLKTIEDIFKHSSLKRCHRSYIVNVEKIKLVEKKLGKLYLHLKNVKTVIPVSRNYTTTFNLIISSIPK